MISKGLYGLLAELMFQNFYPGPNRRSTSPLPLACFTHSIQSQVHVLGPDVPGFQTQNANSAISGLKIFASMAVSGSFMVNLSLLSVNIDQLSTSGLLSIKKEHFDSPCYVLPPCSYVLSL